MTMVSQNMGKMKALTLPSAPPIKGPMDGPSRGMP